MATVGVAQAGYRWEDGRRGWGGICTDAEEMTVGERDGPSMGVDAGDGIGGSMWLKDGDCDAD